MIVEDNLKVYQLKTTLFFRAQSVRELDQSGIHHRRTTYTQILPQPSYIDTYAWRDGFTSYVLPYTTTVMGNEDRSRRSDGRGCGSSALKIPQRFNQKEDRCWWVKNVGQCTRTNKYNSEIPGH